MTARIEITAENVKEAQAEMLAMLQGSEVLHRSLEDEYRRGELTEKWAKEDAVYSLADTRDLIAFVNNLASLISSGKASEFFPDHSIDMAKCERISALLETLLKIKQRKEA